MARRGDDRQFSLDGYFAVPREPDSTPGAFAFSLELRNLLSRAMKESPLSRYALAARLTDLIYGDAGEGEVTKAQLDSWSRSSDAWRFPLEVLPAFVEATGAYWLLDKVAERCGCRVLIGEDAVLAELGAVSTLRERLGKREAALKKSVPDSVLRRLTAERRGS